MFVPPLNLSGLSEAEFLRDYWQKRPCLIRQGLPGIDLDLSPEELAGLACEEEVPARILVETGDESGWAVRHGPFTEADFTALPETGWTLLVTDMEKLLPELRALVRPFRFIPDWRIDDLMLSYAVPGGSVGPHTDEYDVFLVQVAGRREWRISRTACAEPALRPHPELALLARFEEDEHWILEPGDILYLPPRVPHWGISRDTECMTASVGFRAPTWRELLGGVVDRLMERPALDERYADPDLQPREHPALLLDEELRRMRQRIEQLLRFDDAEFRRWIGELLTTPVDETRITGEQMATDDLRAALDTGAALRRNPWSRLLLVNGDNGLELFADGHRHPLSPAQEPLARLIADADLLPPERLLPLVERQPEAMVLLLALCSTGVLEWADDPDPQG